MHISDQRTTLIDANQIAQRDLESFISFLTLAAKFQGQGDDWIRTSEVWPILRAIRNDLEQVIEKIRS